jgi:hypothetical protein
MFDEFGNALDGADMTGGGVEDYFNQGTGTADPNYNTTGDGSTLPGNISGVGGVLNSLGQFVDQYGNVIRQAGNAASTKASWDKVKEGYSKGIGTLQDFNANTMSRLDPYSQAGIDAMGRNKEIGTTGTTQADVQSYYNPGMKFALGQGQAAIERSAAARGGVMGSGALQDIASFITGQASQNYNNAATLAQANTAQKVAANQGIIGAGTTATTTGATLNERAGENIAQGQVGLGNAQGQGIAGVMGSLNRAPVSSSNTYNTTGGGGNTPAGGGGGGGDSGLGDVMKVAGTVASIASLFSDSKVKNDIVDLDNNEMRTILEGMHAKEFTYNEYAINKGAPKGRNYGILTDDLVKTDGKILIIEEDGVMKLDTVKTINFLLASVASLQAQLTELKGV